MEASKRIEPVPQYGAFSFVHNNQFYVCQGKRDDSPTKDGSPRNPFRGKACEEHLLPLQRYDFSSAQWSGVSPVCEDPAEQLYWRELGIQHYPSTDVCCAVLGNCAYTFGGDCGCGYAVHELNLETMVWRRIETQNSEEGPIQNKRRAGMVTCGDEALCVFGGVGSDESRHQPGATYRRTHPSFHRCVTNELHLFHIGTGTWSSPETTGPRPPPCIEFSFTKVDLSRAVLFGGRNIEEGYRKPMAMNELHILDLVNWHWSGAILPSSPAHLWSQGTTRHSACALFEPTPSCSSATHTTTQHNPQLFVLWGADSHGHGIAKAWILDINSISWKQVTLPPGVGGPRECFSFGFYSRSSTEAELVVFGGNQSITTRRHDRNPVGATTLFYIGVKTLYHSCVDYVAERYELYQPLLQQVLPPHIQTDIHVERDKRVHYRVIQL